MLKSNLVAKSTTELLNKAGIHPGVWSEPQVGALIYVVVPMAFPYAKARGGKNKSEVSLFFKGGFMSTRSKAEGREVVHTSAPFIQFMSELPRKEEAFERKPGETQIYRISQVTEEMEDSKEVFVVEGVKATRWRHKVTEAEQSRKLAVGSRIPYNFRLELGVQTLATLVGGETDWADQWEALKEVVPQAQPQLHLLVCLGSETHLNQAENKEVFGMEGVQAYHVNLSSENIVAAKWVMAVDELYDQSACLPDNPVCHDEEFEDLPDADVKQKPKSVGEVLSLKNPAGTLRKLWLKQINTLKMELDQLDEFLSSLSGDLEFWWNEKIGEEGRATVRAELSQLKRSAKAEAKAEGRRQKEAKAEAKAETQQPVEAKAEVKAEAKAEVQKEVAAPASPQQTPNKTAFAGIVLDDWDEFEDM